MKDNVVDRSGNEIYLTDERWQHLTDNHDEMQGLRERTLDVLKTGQRKQDPLDPSKYKYSQRYDDLAPGYNTIVVVVKYSSDRDTGQPNNFVLTAYQVYAY